jgi:O-Antigen ligase
MLQSIKNLIVVLFIAAIVFRLTKPIMLLYGAEQDFLRRRRVWYVLTVAAFLTPSVWLFVAVAVPVLFLTSERDFNPGGLYLFMLHVVPGAEVHVPGIGSLSTQFMLTISILVPAAYRLRQSKGDPRIRGLHSIDWLLLGYIVLSSVLYLHQIGDDGNFFPSTATDFLRKLFFRFFEMFVPYFVISRSNCSRRAIVDSVAYFWLSCALMAAIGIFEGLRGWLLYQIVPSNWGVVGGVYLMRADSLRAMASSGHPLSLGYLLAIAFGCWLYLQLAVQSKLARIAIVTLIWLGEFAAYSRGPWICAILIFLLFAAQKPGAASAVTKSLFAGAVAATIVALTPLGQKIANVIPFFGGHVDTQNIEYRQRLWDRGWDVILQSPLLGDQYAMAKMQDLKQGEGIIDFVNGYIAELLATGFVGLSLFLSVIVIGIGSAWVSSRTIRRVDKDFSLLGASLVSCLLGTLFLYAFGGVDSYVLWAFVALCSAYLYVGRQREFAVFQRGSVRQGAAAGVIRPG